MEGDIQNTDEVALIAQAREDPSAFGALYDRYANRIYAFAVRQTHDPTLAKDILSSTFEQALKHLRRYRWQGVSFGAWLYRIARNEIAQHYRQQTIRNVFSLKLPIQNNRRELEHHIEVRQQNDKLHHALQRLSHADQELIELRFFADLSSAEVAEILDCSVQKVYVRLHRALTRLRTQMELLDLKGETIYASE